MKFLLSVPLVLMSLYAFASESKASAVSVVSFLTSYNQYGGGDVKVSLEDNGADCPNGFWLSKADVGFEANFSMLLAAAQSSSKIRIYGLPDQLWSGSSAPTCKVYSVEFHK